MTAEQESRTSILSMVERLLDPLSFDSHSVASSAESESIDADNDDKGPGGRERNHRGNFELYRASRTSDENIHTPEEKIITILNRKDGWMKQSEIVNEMEYSESSVSRKLSKMESAGAIKRFRIGREKIVFLPGSVPASFDSPLDRKTAD